MLRDILKLSALIAVVLLVRAAFKNRVPKRMIYCLWLVVLLKLCLPGTLFSLPVLPAEDAAAPAQSAELPAQTTPVIQQHAQTVTKPQTPAQQPVSPAQKTVKSAEKPLTTAQILQIVWFSGSALLGLWLFGAWLVFTIRLHRDRRFLGKRGGTCIYVSGAVKSPCLAGLIPAVYLTKDVLQADEAELILHHELTHLRHLDFLWSFCRTAAVIVYWWNPFIWLAAICSKRDAELACDEAVAAKLPEKERLAYARAILAQVPRKTAALSLAGPPVKERILFLTKKQRTSVLCVILVLLLVVSAAGCSFAELTRKTPKKSAPTEEEAQPQPEIESTSFDAQIPVDETARAEWFDFAHKWRLDVLPVFADGAAPKTTSAYLDWIFMRDMDTLKKQGYMDRQYVETQIKTHFEAQDLTHGPLDGSWNYDGERYTAVPLGLPDENPARLDSVTALKEDGRTVYHAQYCRMWYGRPLSDDTEWNRYRDEIISGAAQELREGQEFLLSFYIHDGEPVFLSHTEAVQSESFLRDAAFRARFTSDASQVPDGEIIRFLQRAEAAAHASGANRSGLEFSTTGRRFPSSVELFMLFLTWTSDEVLESYRSPEDELYRFPRSAICRTLDCYFKEYVFDITYCEGYDEQSGMVVLSALPVLSEELDMQMYGKKSDGDTVTYGFDFYSPDHDDTADKRAYARREYTLQCYDGGFNILSAESRNTPDPEEGIGGIRLWDAWDMLPQTLTEGFADLGIIGPSRDNYDVVKYVRGGLSVHVIRLQADKMDDIPGLDGRVCGVFTTSQDDPTPRGLRVGDSESRAQELYGTDYLWWNFGYAQQDGTITRMGFFTYYDDSTSDDAFEFPVPDGAIPD